MWDRLGGTLHHYASLVVAESPVEAHRTFLERQREDEERLIFAEERRTQDEEVLTQSDDLERQQMEAETRRSIAVQRSVLGMADVYCQACSLSAS
jgi:hypothetical protein